MTVVVVPAWVVGLPKICFNKFEKNVFFQHNPSKIIFLRILGIKGNQSLGFIFSGHRLYLTVEKVEGIAHNNFLFNQCSSKIVLKPPAASQPSPPINKSQQHRKFFFCECIINIPTILDAYTVNYGKALCLITQL